MALRVMKFRDWQRASAAHLGKPSYARFTGTSPGGVANALGVSRQAIHQAIKRGTLDAISVHDERGELMFMLVSDAAVATWQASKEQQRRAG